MNRVLAFLCRICPVCVYARRRPSSKLAKTLEHYQRYCPACRAYKRIYEGTSHESTDHRAL